MLYESLMQLTLTAAMAGLMWLVQLVHYPLFSGLAEASFKDWHAFHGKRISFIVMPLMVSELGLAIYLQFKAPSTLQLSILILNVLIWVSTALLSVPLHTKLEAHGADKAHIAALVKTNWPRTLCYTVKAALAFWFAAKVGVGLTT
jgi:hypothetical protein